MSGRLKQVIKTLNIGHKIRHLLSPHLCLLCAGHCGDELYLCAHCAADLTAVATPCPACGLPNPLGPTICAVCLKNPPPWQSMRAPLIYRGATRRLLHDFKFHQQQQAGAALLRHIGAVFAQSAVDVLIPVPLHREREIERGFNQSTEIALQLAALLDLSVDSHSLQRVRATDPQSGLSLTHRRNNLRGAFSWRNHQQCPRSVAVIDDVVTTASTVSEVSRVLRRAGVEHIEIWGIARALKHA